MALPTFLLAGAQRCGTTTMHRLLKQHRHIFMARPKELHFFDVRWDNGLEWYEQHFRVKPRHTALGEATPIYLYDAQARERMIRTLPDVRLLVMLRNPVDRAYSHYLQSIKRGKENLPTFEEALAAEPKRLKRYATKPRRAFSYVDRGHFIDQLEAVEKAYGRDRLHVVLLDDLKRDRVGTLEGVFRFLDVDPAPAATIKEKWANRQPKSKDSPMRPETRARLVEHFRPYNERLGEWLGRDLSHWQ